MQVTITLEKNKVTKVFQASEVLFISDWLDLVTEVTRSEYTNVAGVAVEHHNGEMSWSEESAGGITW